jgi:hypothetical protein
MIPDGPPDRLFSSGVRRLHRDSLYFRGFEDFKNGSRRAHDCIIGDTSSSWSFRDVTKPLDGAS